MSTVTWVLNGSDYEISSVGHLLQLMHQGSASGYTDAGTPPASAADYWTSSYIQTVDIDLATDSLCSPIGHVVTAFTGNYDGQGFSISNWSQFSVSFATRTGFFGICTGSTIKNIVCEGVWNNSPTNPPTEGSLVAAYMNNCNLYNITTNFATGSGVAASGGTGDSGIITGYANNCTYENITIGGVITTATATGNFGGCIGEMNNTTITYVRNIAVFENGMSTTTNSIGGIVGTGGNSGNTYAYLMNAMTGNISNTNSNGYAGGIIGTLADTGAPFDYAVNSMIGNITCSHSDAAGGIAGKTTGTTVPCTRVFNYMKGDVSAGFIGESGYKSFQESWCAINGTVTDVVYGSHAGTDNVITLDDSYGMTYSSSNQTQTPDADTTTYDETISGLGLPYFEFSSTDAAGNVFEWPFVFANLGNFINSTTLYNYVATENTTGIFNGTDDLLADVFANWTTTVITFVVFTIAAGAISLTVAWEAETGATKYKVSYSDGTNEVTSDAAITDLQYTIQNLVPESTYTVYLSYSTSTAEPSLTLGLKNSTTLANIAANYDSSAFGDVSSGFDLSTLNASSLESMSGVLNDLFASGNQIDFNVGGQTKSTEFLKRGETATLTEDDVNISIPFDTSSGSGQTATLSLFDTTTVSLTYDESTDEVTIGGTAVSSGQSIILDGKKVQVFNI